jgi:hypothetical protein
MGSSGREVDIEDNLNQSGFGKLAARVHLPRRALGPRRRHRLGYSASLSFHRNSRCRPSGRFGRWLTYFVVVAWEGVRLSTA